MSMDSVSKVWWAPVVIVRSRPEKVLYPLHHSHSEVGLTCIPSVHHLSIVWHHKALALHLWDDSRARERKKLHGKEKPKLPSLSLSPGECFEFDILLFQFFFPEGSSGPISDRWGAGHNLLLAEIAYVSNAPLTLSTNHHQSLLDSVHHSKAGVVKEEAVLFSFGELDKRGGGGGEKRRQKARCEF